MSKKKDKKEEIEEEKTKEEELSEIHSTVFASIETGQYERLRLVALENHKTIAEVVREALQMYLDSDEVP